MLHLGDITKISGYSAPIVDCIIGGSPCQDLSVAGKRAGLDGERSGLYIEQVRIVKEMRERDERNGRTGVDIRPRYMVWENVPGAFSSNKGEDFRIVLEELAKVADKDAVVPMPDNGKWTTCGCIVGDGWSIAWRVLDAQFWGVPQRRRRIALVADFGGQSASEILFVSSRLSGHTEPSRAKRKEPSPDATGGFGANDCIGADQYNAVILGDTVSTLGVNCGMSHGRQCVLEPQIAYTLQDREGKAGGGKGALIAKELSATLRAGFAQTLFQPVYSVENHPNDSRVGINEDGLVQTLSSRMGTGGGNVPMVLALDRASFNQGKNAQFDFEVSDNGINSPIIAKGPSAVCYQAYPEVRDGVVGTLDAHYSAFPGCRGGMERTMVAQAVDCRNCTEDDINGSLQSNSAHSLNGNNVVRIRYIVRRLTPLECERLQGYPDGWTKLIPIDDMSNEEYEFWTAEHFERAVRDGKARPSENGVYEIWKATEIENEEGEIEEIWENTHKPYKDKTKAQMIKWYNKLIEGDAARYKALGNSIALPPWKWVLKRLCACYERDATMASLFDGIGGFPYLWEQLNGKGSCLWASEIEEFPIAVTKVRIGG